MEPFCSLGGTTRARTGLSSVKFGLAFVNVACLIASVGRMRPGNSEKERKKELYDACGGIYATLYSALYYIVVFFDQNADNCIQVSK